MFFSITFLPISLQQKGHENFQEAGRDRIEPCVGDFRACQKVKQREAKESDQIDIQDVASEPELSLALSAQSHPKRMLNQRRLCWRPKKVTELTKALEIKKQ